MKNPLEHFRTFSLTEILRAMGQRAGKVSLSHTPVMQILELRMGLVIRITYRLQQKLIRGAYWNRALKIANMILMATDTCTCSCKCDNLSLLLLLPTETIYLYSLGVKKYVQCFEIQLLYIFILILGPLETSLLNIGVYDEDPMTLCLQI